MHSRPRHQPIFLLVGLLVGLSFLLVWMQEKDDNIKRTALNERVEGIYSQNSPITQVESRTRLLIGIVSTWQGLRGRIQLAKDTWLQRIGDETEVRVFVGDLLDPGFNGTDFKSDWDEKISSKVRLTEVGGKDKEYPPVAKVRRIIESVRQDFDTRARFTHFLLVDDDAYVNVEAWEESVLEAFPDSMPVYAGQVLVYDGRKARLSTNITYIASGPGVLMTKATMQMLHQTLKITNDSSDYTWNYPCHPLPHSDLTLGACLGEIGVRPTHIVGVLSENPVRYGCASVDSKLLQNHAVHPLPSVDENSHSISPSTKSMLLALHRIPVTHAFWRLLHMLFHPNTTEPTKDIKMSLQVPKISPSTSSTNFQPVRNVLESHFDLTHNSRLYLVHDPPALLSQLKSASTLEPNL